MTLVKRNRTTFPSVMNDFFNTGRFPSLFDFERNLIDFDGGTSYVIPSANIVEHDKVFRIELAAPGLDRKDFKVEFNNGILNVSAEKEEERKDERKNYYRREFSYNSFSRSFSLPENSLPEKIDAKYEDGILNITIPKKETTVLKHAKEIAVS